MEENTEITMLLDFYGQLLTPRQYEILDLHYNSDFSLGEIAGQLSISRQGVYDGVRKGKETLKRFEEKLGLVKRFRKHDEALRDVLACLQDIRKDMDMEKGINRSQLHYCVEKLKNVINDL